MKVLLQYNPLINILFCGEYMNQLIKPLFENISKVIVGKDDTIIMACAALLAKGHLLIEDAPGLGKTILARALSQSIKGRFGRVQCTPDLLPSDITGISIYNEKSQEFKFRPGPVFSNIVLVDEINRTTPRTQSSLLEAMAERQVSVDSKTYKMREPFMVMATQNPVEYHGTYPLPEAQLDRFLMKLSMGYPDLNQEISILKMQQEQHPIETLQAVIEDSEIVKMQQEVATITIDDKVLRYITMIVRETRKHNDVMLGVSPRGSLALMRVSQALAFIEGQTHVTPHMVKRASAAVLAHRILLKPQVRAEKTPLELIEDIISSVSVPL
jgi:MoxR-like ATPase